MARIVFFSVSAAVLLLPLQALGAGAVINEILFNPAGDDTGAEWVEVYNAGDVPQDLTGWQLYPDGAGYFSFPAGFSLGAKKFVVVHLRASAANTAADLYDAASSANMSNTAGSAALFSATPRGRDTIKSFVQWGRGGETWESAAADAGLWQKGLSVATTSAAEGLSIGFSSDGAAAGYERAWSVFSSPTPGSSNGAGAGAISAASSSSSSSSLPAASRNNFVAPAEALAFRAYAGGDRTSAAGSETEFIGTAVGKTGEPMHNVRFLWNFGDGEIKEGRVVWHIFQIPGTYMAGLHVTSDTNVISDYARILVVPNKITVADVKEGADGFVRLKNQGEGEVDIGEWVLEDGQGKRFVVPARSKVAAGAEMALANRITGLFQGPGAWSLALSYPNFFPAGTWRAGDKKEVFSSFSPVSQQASGALVAKNNQSRIAPAAAEIVSALSGAVQPPQAADAGSRATSSPRAAISAPRHAPAGRSVFFLGIAGLISASVAAGFFIVKLFL